MQRAVALAAALLGAGCGVSGVGFCNTDDECENGQICRGGACAAGEPFRAPAEEAPAPVVDDEEPPPPPVTPSVDPCGPVIDAFDGSVISEGLWVPFAEGGASVGEGDGALVVKLPASADFTWAGVAVGPLKVDGRSVTAAIPQVPEDAAALAFILLQASDAEEAFVVVNNGYIEAGVVHGDQNPTMSAVYDATQVLLRLREESGTLFFETSSDGDTFVPLAALPSPDFSGGAILALAAQAEGTQVDTSAAFDAVASPQIECP